jgi:hypothetical protein
MLTGWGRPTFAVSIKQVAWVYRHSFDLRACFTSNLTLTQPLSVDSGTSSRRRNGGNCATGSRVEAALAASEGCVCSAAGAGSVGRPRLCRQRRPPAARRAASRGACPALRGHPRWQRFAPARALGFDARLLAGAVRADMSGQECLRRNQTVAPETWSGCIRVLNGFPLRGSHLRNMSRPKMLTVASTIPACTVCRVMDG